jgi:uncharacterized repeat protein (TIGR03803 family)
LANCADGSRPYSALVEGSDGNFYGTTELGGSTYGSGDCESGCGTIYQVTPSGTFTTLYNFCTDQPSCPDGLAPTAGLMQATDGNFYGNTEGGPGSGAVLFRFSMGFSPCVETYPGFGKAGSALRILGYGLTGTSSVSFNGTAAVFKVVSDTEITTTVPAGATTGTIEVATPSGTLSSNFAFQVPQ